MQKEYFGIEPILEEYVHPSRAWKYGKDVHRAMTEFLGHPGKMPDAALSHFADWFVFDYVGLDDRRIIDRFVAENPTHLAPQEISAYQEILGNNRFDFFDVTRVEPKQLDLVSLRDSIEYSARVPGKSHGVEKRDVIVCRIGKLAGAWHILSLDPIGMPRPTKRDKIRMVSAFPIPNPKFIYQDIVAHEIGDRY